MFCSLRELFNMWHSSIKNIVEQTFGVMKRHYPILKGLMPYYKILWQCTIIIAYCVVHNIIRENNEADQYFAEFVKENTASAILDEQ